MGSCLNMADQRAATFVVLLGEQNYMIQLFLLTSMLIIVIDHTIHMWPLGMFWGPDLAKQLYFGELTFSTQVKSMESSRNMTRAYNVAYNMANIMRSKIMNIIYTFEYRKSYLHNIDFWSNLVMKSFSAVILVAKFRNLAIIWVIWSFGYFVSSFCMDFPTK